MDESTETTVGRERPRARLSEWIRYLVAVAATGFVLLSAFFAVIAGLDSYKTLPPPGIVNEVCADEKLEWLRDHPNIDPNLLIVGSSIAWRNIDSAQLVKHDPSIRPLNGGVCHAFMNQTEFVTGYLLRHFPDVRTVVAVVTPQDFIDCSKAPSRLFDPATADAYAFDRYWAYLFYVLQFDPVALTRNAIEIRGMREGRVGYDWLVMSPYADGPLKFIGSRKLVYGALDRYDAACFAALHGIAQAAASSGRRLFVATSPLNPRWSARFDPEGRRYREMLTGIEAALRGTGAAFWDGSQIFADEPPAFADAIHIIWPAAQRYATRLAAALDAAKSRP